MGHPLTYMDMVMLSGWSMYGMVYYVGRIPDNEKNYSQWVQFNNYEIICP